MICIIMKKRKQKGVINTLIGKYYEKCGKKMTNGNKKRHTVRIRLKARA